MASKKVNEVAKVENGNGVKFVALDTENAATVAELLEQNVGQGGVAIGDLDRSRFPSGGNMAWNVPTIENEAASQKEIVGIIVAWIEPRAYWQKAFTGSTPPNCRSNDGVVGVGDPGGACRTCPLAQFESKSDGSGGFTGAQACKVVRQLLVLRPDDIMPLVVNIPPTSLKTVRKYFLQLTSKRLSHRHVVTAIGLEPDKNANGITYAKATFRLVRKLDDAEILAVNPYANQAKMITADNAPNPFEADAPIGAGVGGQDDREPGYEG